MVLRTNPTIRDVIDDPREFIARLAILTKQNAVRQFHPMWPETELYLDALLGPRHYLLAVKPRQVAYTTATTAYQFWKGYTSPRAHRCVQVVHEREAMERLKEMVAVFHDHLPASMQRGLATHNEKRTRFAHNRAGFNRILAGGRGQARAWAFNDAHFTEMAYYPSATAASSQDAAGSTAEGMWQSALATLDDTDPDFKVTVESTGNGPRGLFYKLWKQARNDPKWAYVFVPWNVVSRYSDPLTKDEEAAFLDTLTTEERDLAGAPHFLTAGQLAWRRRKMTQEQWTVGRFKREYPLTDLEPFLSSVSGWFDTEAINRQLGWARHPLARDRAMLRVFHEYEPGRRYFIGVDTSGGVGQDYAAIQVVRDDLLHAATWATNTAHPRDTATWVSRLAHRYGGSSDHPPLALVEANNHGVQVLERLRSLGAGKGCELWRDPNTDGDFWSTGRTAGNRKRDAMLWARELIEDDRVIIECVFTLLQLQQIVEKWNGKIEAVSNDAVELEDKDDLAMALVLALYAARRHVSGNRIVTLQQERDAVAARIRTMFPGGPRA